MLLSCSYIADSWPAVEGLRLSSPALFWTFVFEVQGFTHRLLHGSSFLGLPYRILNMIPKRNYYGASK